MRFKVTFCGHLALTGSQVIVASNMAICFCNMICLSGVNKGISNSHWPLYISEHIASFRLKASACAQAQARRRSLRLMKIGVFFSSFMYLYSLLFVYKLRYRDGKFIVLEVCILGQWTVNDLKIAWKYNLCINHTLFLQRKVAINWFV